jgi:hypothetical protein
MIVEVERSNKVKSGRRNSVGASIDDGNLENQPASGHIQMNGQAKLPKVKIPELFSRQRIAQTLWMRPAEAEDTNTLSTAQAPSIQVRHPP